MKTSPFKSITFCIFIIFYSLSEGFLLNKKSRSLYNLQMTNELLKFGDKLSISIKVPTKDTRILSSFLSIPHKMIEAAYDKDSITKISDDHYLLKLASLTLPGESWYFSTNQMSVACLVNVFIDLKKALIPLHPR